MYFTRIAFVRSIGQLVGKMFQIGSNLSTKPVVRKWPFCATCSISIPPFLPHMYAIGYHATCKVSYTKWHMIKQLYSNKAVWKLELVILLLTTWCVIIYRHLRACKHVMRSWWKLTKWCLSVASLVWSPTYSPGPYYQSNYRWHILENHCPGPWSSERTSQGTYAKDIRNQHTVTSDKYN